MIIFLRYLSLANASIWCGSAIFMIICVPAIFSPEMKRLLTAPYVGFPAEAVMARYFILQYCCAGIALVHLVAEGLYLGRPVHRFTLWLLVAVTCLGLIGGLGLQPKLRKLHVAKYWGPTPALRADAGRSFKAWHVVAESVNLLLLGGVVVYLLRVNKNNENSRFLGLNKIRS